MQLLLQLGSVTCRFLSSTVLAIMHWTWHLGADRRKLWWDLPVPGEHPSGWRRT